MYIQYLLILICDAYAGWTYLYAWHSNKKKSLYAQFI